MAILAKLESTCLLLFLFYDSKAQDWFKDLSTLKWESYELVRVTSGSFAVLDNNGIVIVLKDSV